jgi:hypothetical protein
VRRTAGAARHLKTASLLVAIGALLPACTPPARADSLAARPDRAPPPARAARAADFPRRSGDASSAPRAPSLPPLPASAEAPADEQAGVGSTAGEADPLVSNGLGSPLCRGGLGGEALSASGRRACETSGFAAAGAPTSNFGLDVHIDTGFLGLSSGSLLRVVQDLLIAPVWMALVWAVHALVVMLEWSFTFDLLDSASAGLGAGLRHAQAQLTEPLLAGVLAVASVLALYHGLIRRRVGETLAGVLLAGTMMAGGLWVMADPSGTVGALGGWANQASLGTLAVSARGSPAGAGRTLGDSMASIFAAAIEVPWCYLEFGDVGWCRNPARLDPALRSAGLRIAARELALVPGAGGAASRSLEHSAELLRTARSNGALFLALPANGPDRNSINDEGSLLRTMCHSGTATACRGPAAAQAEFRTGSGTLKRIGGLVLILAGVLGMLLLFGFIALRLLGAAILSLLYLLLAPAAVLAPALGETGRTVFRRWAAQLLAAVMSKLLFAFLLGAALGVLAILAALEALGWWTQWLLMSAFWWGAYGRRHQILTAGAGSARPEVDMRRASLGRRAREALEPPRRLVGAARAVSARLRHPAPEVRLPGGITRAARERTRAQLDEQATRTLAHDDRRAAQLARELPQRRALLAAKHAQLERIQRARTAALAAHDPRRAAKLAVRGGRVEEETAQEHERVRAALARKHTRGRRGARGAEQLRERARFLDEQGALADSRRVRAGAPRDYAGLAGLAGFAREEYERLAPARRREAWLEIDRELALRRRLPLAAHDIALEGEQVPTRREQHAAARAMDNALERRMREDGHELPLSRASWLEAWRRESSARAARGANQSPVMRDAREVLMRRKRQLGYGRD